jgi:hypothetical protein
MAWPTPALCSQHVPVERSSVAGVWSGLEPDPELLALPAPPKRERTITIVLMLVTAIAAASLAWSLRSEALYALSEGQPVELGDLSSRAPDASLANRYVQATGLLGSQGAIKYTRAAEGDSFRLAPLAGTSNVWVEIRVPEGFEGPRFIPPSSFAGRLVPLERAGLRHAKLAGGVKDRTGVEIPVGAWLLVDGSSPRASRWALLLSVLFGAFAAWNVASVGRILARVRDEGGAAGRGADGETAAGAEPRA